MQEARWVKRSDTGMEFAIFRFTHWREVPKLLLSTDKSPHPLLQSQIMAPNLQKTVTNLLGCLVGLLVAGLGFLLICLGHACPSPLWKEVVKDVGGCLLGIGVLAILWEVFTKRSFREETLAMVNVSATLDKAGVEAIELDYLSLDWKSLFDSAEKLDVFFAYGGTWRGTHLLQLQNLLTKKGMKLRILLPDPACNDAVAELSRRFVGYSTEKAIRVIGESVQTFDELRVKCPQGTTVEVRFTKTTPLFAIYNFGRKAVFTMYRHKPGKGEVPTYIVQRGGTLYGFMENEFDSLWEANAPQTTPPASVEGEQP